MYKYNGTYILSIIYKYKGTVNTYYHVQIQRYSTYLLSCTYTNVYYILITMYKCKGIVHTYYLQRYIYVVFFIITLQYKFT